MTSNYHQAGFVHIIGKPNAGKSTLFNTLLKESLSIATHKPQTTRHNIVGLHSSENFQIVYVDTPGYMEPAYALQETMMKNVKRALVDSDVLIWLVDIREETPDPLLLTHLTKKEKRPFFLVLNKLDLLPPEALDNAIERWSQQVPATEVLAISALHKHGIELLIEKIVKELPIHPPYYDKADLSDKPSRFFAAEMIRKAIFIQYKQEIPYSTEVVIERFQDEEAILHLHATIFVERLSQKGILIGKGGSALKKVGIAARRDLEKFFKKKVFLKQHVKVLPDWRNRKNILAQWGYQ